MQKQTIKNTVFILSILTKRLDLFVCVEVFTAQTTKWGHVEGGQFI